MTREKKEKGSGLIGEKQSKSRESPQNVHNIKKANGKEEDVKSSMVSNKNEKTQESQLEIEKRTEEMKYDGICIPKVGKVELETEMTEYGHESSLSNDSTHVLIAHGSSPKQAEKVAIVTDI